jgi:hypothetical protein
MMKDRSFHFPFMRAGVIGVLCLAMGLFSSDLHAQEQWEKEGEGEIKDVQIEIVKDRQIVLPRANRNFEKVMPRPYEPIKPAITYELKTFKFTTPDYSPAVRPLKLKPEELSRIYGNYLSGGVGNYASFYFEGSITTKRDKNKFLGAHLFTRNFGTGPVGGKNSASSNTQLQLFGKTTGSALTLSGELGYENRGTYFYGYNPFQEVNRDRIRQVYDIFGAKLALMNTKAGDFNYQLSGGFSYLSDHYHASESETSVSFSSDYKIKESGKFLLKAEYFLINRTDSLVASSPRHLFRIKPYYQFSPVDKLLLTAGLNIALQNDQYSGSKDFHVYPHIKAQYQLSPSIEAYGVVTGDMDKVDLHTLSAENLWVNSNIQIYHTNRDIEFSGGLAGKVGSNVAIGAGVSVASLKNYYYYYNVQTPTSGVAGSMVSKFDVVYDKNTQRLNPFAEISYSKADIFNISLRGDYFKYSTETFSEPLHRPTYRVAVNSRYNLYSKILIEAGFIAQGGMKVPSPADPLPSSSAFVSLDPAFDLNLKGRYFFSKEFSAFLQFNNILGNNYPLYLAYPSRGFQALAGVSWSF